jgi:hypothetical protein
MSENDFPFFSLLQACNGSGTALRHAILTFAVKEGHLLLALVCNSVYILGIVSLHYVLLIHINIPLSRSVLGSFRLQLLDRFLRDCPVALLSILYVNLFYFYSVNSMTGMDILVA